MTTLVRMLAHASLALQAAFSCLLVCLLEFYYRKIAREAWMRWFAFSWVAQVFYVAGLWVVYDRAGHTGLVLRLFLAVLGYVFPASVILTAIAVWRAGRPPRRWIVIFFAAALGLAAATFLAALSHPVGDPAVSRIYTLPRFLCYAAASLLCAAAFADYAGKRRLTGAAVTAAAWAFFGLINLVRALEWYRAPGWTLTAAEDHPDFILFALITFITNSIVWVVMCMGVGLLLTENAERSERRTRQALADLQAAQSERGRLARLVEHSRDAILVLSGADVAYLNAAAAALLGYSGDRVPSLLLRPVAEVCGVAAGDALRMHMPAAIQSAGVWEGQSEWRNSATGERIPVLVSAAAIEARPGEPPSTGIIARDLRDRLRLEEELRHSQRQEALGRLAGGIAHDFNNLLTVIMGYSSLALTEKLSDSMRLNIGEILNAARRAAAITDRLRAFGRRQAMHPAEFDLNGMVDSMRGALQKLVDAPVDLSYDLDPGTLPVYADPAQIEQVLMNLVLNARQAIAGPGRVAVRTGRDGDAYVILEVQDTGCGIEPEVLEHIFDPYFTTRSAGTGLGLSMAFGVVKQSGGQMRVSSRPGQGSTFTVLLPVSAAPRRPAPARSLSPVSQDLYGQEVVMIVEDRPDVLSFVRHCLEHYGYRTLAYGDAESALAAIRAGAAPQVVIRDVMMPGMPVKDFAAQFRQAMPGVPLIFMSGLPEPSIASLIEGAGGHFIGKPFSQEQLVSLVRRVLDAAAILDLR